MGAPRSAGGAHSRRTFVDVTSVATASCGAAGAAGFVRARHDVDQGDAPSVFTASM